MVVTPQNVLHISGERSVVKEEGTQGEGAWRLERSYGSFERSFWLPENVQADGEGGCRRCLAR